MDVSTARRARESISVHIDELVLHGLTPAERRRVADVLAAELERLIAEQGWPAEGWTDRQVEALSAGVLRGAATPAGTGRAIAALLWNALQPRPEAGARRNRSGLAAGETAAAAEGGAARPAATGAGTAPVQPASGVRL